MTVARALRRVDGHTYELTVDYRDVGTSGFAPEFLAGTWRVTRDGEPVGESEVERIRREIFTDADDDGDRISTVQRLFGTCQHCGRRYEGRRGYPTRFACECGMTDELQVVAIMSDASPQEAEWVRRELFGAGTWQVTDDRPSSRRPTPRRREITDADDDKGPTAIQRLFGTCRHCGRSYEGRRGYPTRFTCGCGITDELQVVTITSDVTPQETEWARRELFGVAGWQQLTP